VKKIAFLFWGICWGFALPIFAQNSPDSIDFVTVTVNIVDYMDETVFVDTHLSVLDSTGNKIINSENQIGQEFYQKLDEGYYQLLLKKGQLYTVISSEFQIDCEVIYEEDREDIDLSKTNRKQVPLIIRKSSGSSLQFDNVNFNTNKPKSARKKHLIQAIQAIPKSIEICHNVLAFMEDYPQSTIKLESHSIPKETKPEKLAKWRALALKYFLTQKGIAPKRIEIVSYGSSSPMVPNNSENNQALNRRVVIEPLPEPCEEK